MEGILASLGACQAITAKYMSKPMKINLRNFRVEVNGEYNLEGYDNDKKNIGFHSIQLVMHIDADNTQEEIEKFAEAIENHCPVSATIKVAEKFLPTKIVRD